LRHGLLDNGVHLRGELMGISKDQFRDRDIYLDYDCEDVMFRYESATRRFYRKFYGNSKEDDVPYDNRLLNDAMRFGDETDATSYQAGKPRT
jgi:nucleoid-associated protein YejK